jgi:LytS/YehU family sensor histidine kinase
MWLVLSMIITWVLQSLMRPPVAFGQLAFKMDPLRYSMNQLTNYWSFLIIFYWVDAYRRWRERELAAARLAAQLTQARLQALQMQLHPHFLFNILQTIAALIRRDAEAAERMLARLGDLLRIVLDRGEQSMVPLSQELEFVRKYLEIEQIRFGERLHVDWEIAPEVLEAEVPTLILQPLVENAVKHGMAAQSKPGHLKIGAQRQRDQMLLWVQDDGPGLQRDRARDGLGLSNIRERLANLYGSAGSLQIAGGESKGGLKAVIELPIHIGGPLLRFSRRQA